MVLTPCLISHAASSSSGLEPRHSTRGLTSQKLAMGEARLLAHAAYSCVADKAQLLNNSEVAMSDAVYLKILVIGFIVEFF